MATETAVVVGETVYSSPFAQKGYNDLSTSLSESRGAGFEETKTFITGDHFKNGDFYVGPPDKASPAYAEAIKKVASQFLWRDVMNEVVNRVVNGVAKQEPKLDTTPRDTKKEQDETSKKKSQQLLAFCSRWWDHVGFQRKLRKAIRRSRWAEVRGDDDDAEGCGYLRLWIPRSQLQDIPESELGNLPPGTKRIPTGTFEQTIKRIRLSAPHPSNCAIITDEETDEKASVFKFTRGKRDFIEIAWVETKDDGTPGDTVVRVIPSGSSETGIVTNFEEYRWSLGGRLPVIELRAPLLITPAMRTQQKHLNFYETVLLRNTETAGFPERHMINASPSGILVPRREGVIGPYETKEIDGKIFEIHPVPRMMGAGLTTESVGIVLTDDDGRKSITTPTIQRFDPVDPAYTIRACRHGYQRMLEEANQAHILIVGDATSSGVSRQQAEGDHLSDLTDTKDPAEAATRQVFETLIAMGEFFSQSAETYLDEFSITATLFLTPGTPTPDQQRVAIELRGAGGIDETEFMSRIGVEDTAAMISSLETDPIAKSIRLAKLADAVAKMKLAGWSFEGSMKVLGFTQKEIDDAQIGLPDPSLLPPNPIGGGNPPIPIKTKKADPAPSATPGRGSQSNLNGGRGVSKKKPLAVK